MESAHQVIHLIFNSVRGRCISSSKSGTEQDLVDRNPAHVLPHHLAG
jgi:hypothetical protein